MSQCAARAFEGEGDKTALWQGGLDLTLDGILEAVGEGASLPE